MPFLDLTCRASLPENVVLPEPFRPATSTMPGFPFTLISCASEPMNSASSGFTAVSTFAPMALSFTRLQKSFATL